VFPSAERKEAAWAAYEREDYVLAMYLAGLTVECILQAIALRDYPSHDARHDLPRWLGRCPASLQESIKSEAIRAHWSRLVRVWRNELRYLSGDGVLGYLRQQKLNVGISGGPDAVMRRNAKRLLEAAAAVHDRGVYAWARYTAKS
jgi:HEPN domain-containing protein